MKTKIKNQADDDNDNNSNNNVLVALFVVFWPNKRDEKDCKRAEQLKPN